MEENLNKTIPLGKKVGHSETYDPTHLFPVPRKESRKDLGIGASLPFHGEDIWNAYELSWLTPKGKPCVAMGKFSFPCTSEHIVESKSLKLYLNSFNQTRFDTPGTVAETIRKDLSAASGARVAVKLLMPEEFEKMQIHAPHGKSLDGPDIEMDTYAREPAYLTTGAGKAEEQLYSHLLRTNCPVTGQPDWATVMIGYSGKAIDHGGLLRYIVSFRQHTGFHENCVERIFMDILNQCQPERLTVNARFTRRGGLDINPHRSTGEKTVSNIRLARQ
ncbi:MAG: NADPH-dependent 7-cyano-7-deazaguanine reductase QueF [Desulfobacteraceae bacterium]|nr:NADPH-dependent 7-cyano-7-deazaguanine reductase QueF [Desulfobacteraceae bacterium]